jgi:hypothetical protein
MQTYIVRSKKQMIATIQHLKDTPVFTRIELFGTDFSVELAGKLEEWWHKKLINRIKQTPKAMWAKP